MIPSKLKRGGITLALAMVCILSTFAASYDSPTTTFSEQHGEHPAVSFTGWSSLTLNSGREAQGHTWVMNPNQVGQTANTMQTKANLYVGDDIIASTAYRGNGAGEYFMWIQTAAVTTSEQVHSQGQVILEFGGSNDDKERWLEETSTHSPRDATSIPSTYAVNFNNETYGSGLSASTLGYFPDLISAIGSGGAEGYIRAEDLERNSIQELGAGSSSSTIPVYDLDGECIDTFAIITEVINFDKDMTLEEVQAAVESGNY